jgi:hypothetical protein
MRRSNCHISCQVPLTFSGAGRTLGWLRLDQIFHHEARPPEESDPLAIGQLETHFVFPFQAAHPNVVVDQVVGLDILTKKLAGLLRWPRSGEINSCFLQKQTGMLELPRGEVKANRTCAESS